jgi:hypothetical protein
MKNVSIPQRGVQVEVPSQKEVRELLRVKERKKAFKGGARMIDIDIEKMKTLPCRAELEGESYL